MDLYQSNKYSLCFLYTLITLIVCILCGFSSYTHARVNPPSGWKPYNWGTDDFNDTDLGWQWQTIIRFENSQHKDGRQTVTRFRNQNVQMTGSVARIVNFYHNTPINEGGKSTHYSGGWMQSKADWFVQGLFQARTKVGWEFDDIWPTFWLFKDIDELDVMEYQSGQLNQTHHDHNRKAKSARIWARWNPDGAPPWHFRWAMDRVTSWTNWSVMSHSGMNPTFYINGKREHTSNLGRAVHPMKILFTSSPHQRHLPGPGNYPNLEVDWVSTHIP